MHQGDRLANDRDRARDQTTLDLFSSTVVACSAESGKSREAPDLDVELGVL